MEFSEPKGIYMQVADRIRDQILLGVLQAGDRIPSIRDLAVELGINPNTVAKSYQTLVDGKVVINQRGLGYFVCDNAAERVLCEMKNEFFREELPRLLRSMQRLDIRIDELAGLLTRLRTEGETRNET